MKNIGSFFRLARAQLARATNDNPPKDQVLAGLVPETHFPTGLSPERKIANRFVPPAQHMEAMAAIAFFGYEQPTEVSMLFQPHIDRDQALELRARLVDNSQVTAAVDAPCRTWPWRSVSHRLGYERRQAALVHGRFEPTLGPAYTNRFLGDVRDWLLDEWVELTDDVRRGCAWVFDDDPAMAGDETCRLVMEAIKEEEIKHWHAQAAPWSVDTAARWLEVCGRYVQARRVV